MLCSTSWSFLLDVLGAHLIVGFLLNFQSVFQGTIFHDTYRSYMYPISCCIVFFVKRSFNCHFLHSNLLTATKSQNYAVFYWFLFPMAFKFFFTNNFNFKYRNAKCFLHHKCYPGWVAQPKPALIWLSRPKSSLSIQSRQKLALIKKTWVAHWVCQMDFSRARGVPDRLELRTGVPDPLGPLRSRTRSRTDGTLADTFNCWSSSDHCNNIFFSEKFSSFYGYGFWGLQ